MKKGQGKINPILGRVGDRPMWLLYFSIGVRAVHQVGAAVFLVAYLTLDLTILSDGFVLLGVLSGAVLFAAESVRHRQMYRELTGTVTVLKLFLLGLVFHGLIPGVIVIPGIFILSSLASHAPRNIRHRMLF